MCAANAKFVQESAGAIHLAGFLDDLIPLSEASHAEVVEYVVEIPTRYAECFAVLGDGRRVAFRRRRRFIGWTGYQRCRSLLFSSDGLQVVIDIDQEATDGPIGDVCIQAAEAIARPRNSCERPRVRKFIGIDGNQVFLSVV